MGVQFSKHSQFSNGNITSATQTNEYKPAFHPCQKRYNLPKNPDNRGIPPRDGEHRAEENVRTESFLYDAI
jgi:hypothetical protein